MLCCMLGNTGRERMRPIARSLQEKAGLCQALVVVLIQTVAEYRGGPKEDYARHSMLYVLLHTCQRPSSRDQLALISHKDLLKDNCENLKF